MEAHVVQYRLHEALQLWNSGGMMNKGLLEFIKKSSKHSEEFTGRILGR